MTDCVQVDVHLEGDDLAKAPRGRRPGRARPDSQGASAEVVLRRPRLGAVRRDHAAARSTTRPAPNGRSSRRGPRPSRAVTGADTLVELGSGTSEKTRLLLRRAGRRRHAEAVRRRSTSARPRCATHRRRSRSEFDVGVHAVVGDFEHHLHTIPGGGRRLVAFLGGTIGNLDARGTRRVPGHGRERPRPRRLVPARHRPREGRRPARRCVRRRRAASPPSSTATCSASLNRELGSGLRRRALHPRRDVERRRGVDRDVAALRRRATRHDRAPRSHRRLRPRRGAAHRDQRQVPQRGRRVRARRRRPHPHRLVDRPRRRLRPLPLHPLLATRANLCPCRVPDPRPWQHQSHWAICTGR